MADHFSNPPPLFGDTTWTKVFVGGLAWETKSDEMHRFFQQFGEILEAVIIKDKTTGKSKGYGFVSSLFLSDSISGYDFNSAVSDFVIRSLSEILNRREWPALIQIRLSVEDEQTVTSPSSVRLVLRRPEVSPINFPNLITGKRSIDFC